MLKNTKKSKKLLNIVVAFISALLIFSAVVPHNNAFAASTEEERVFSSGGLCYNGTGVLGWIMCPLVKGLSDAFSTVYGWVEDFFKVNVKMFGSGLSTAWGGFRDIANIAFVVLFLIVIISQLTGFGIDNYGIKRILPRLIVVAILVNLSYIICEIAVDVSNIIGKSLVSFMANLVPSTGGGGINIGEGSSWVASIIVGAAGVLSFGIFALILIVLVVGILALLILWVFCVVRDVFVVILTILAPLAFICYMLPNTEKLFQKWLKFFQAMLVIYPICSLMLGAGTLLSTIFSSLNAGIGMSIAAILSLVLPFFAIPFFVINSLNALGKVGGTLKGLATRGFRGGTRLGMAGASKLSANARAGKGIAGGFGLSRRLNEFSRNRSQSAQRRFEEAREGNNRFRNYAAGAGSALAGGILGGGFINRAGQDMVNSAAGDYNRARARRAGQRAENEAWANGSRYDTAINEQAIRQSNEEVKMHMTQNERNSKDQNATAMSEALQSGTAGSTERIIAAIRSLKIQGGEHEMRTALAGLSADQLGVNGPDAANRRALLARELGTNGRVMEQQYAKYLGQHQNDASVMSYEEFSNDTSDDGLGARLNAKYGVKSLSGMDKDELDYIANNPTLRSQFSAQTWARGVVGATGAEAANFVRNLDAMDATQLAQIRLSIAPDSLGDIDESIRTALRRQADGSFMSESAAYSQHFASMSDQGRSKFNPEQLARYNPPTPPPTPTP